MPDDDLLVVELAKPGRFLTGPHIEVKFEAEYSRINEEQRYVYSTHRAIHFDCKIYRTQATIQSMNLLSQSNSYLMALVQRM